MRLNRNLVQQRVGGICQIFLGSGKGAFPSLEPCRFFGFIRLRVFFFQAGCYGRLFNRRHFMSQTSTCTLRNREVTTSLKEIRRVTVRTTETTPRGGLQMKSEILASGRNARNTKASAHKHLTPLSNTSQQQVLGAAGLTTYFGVVRGVCQGVEDRLANVSKFRFVIQ